MSASEHESFKQRARSNLCALPRVLGAIMGASGSTANVPLAQERQRCAQTNLCAARRRFGAIMGGGTYWYGRVVRQRMGMLLCIEERDVGGREATRPRPSVCVMSTGSRTYGPLHSVVIVIEMRALQPTVQHTRHCDGLACKQRTLLLCDYSG